VPEDWPNSSWPRCRWPNQWRGIWARDVYRLRGHPSHQSQDGEGSRASQEV